jgi:subtilisin family serine protease
VDPNHSDLQQRLVNGWNTFNGNNDSRDVFGHGTKVAGAAVATTNNGLGIAGVFWNSLIMPIRVTDTNGYATYTTISNALHWAANNGARVANISFDIIGSSAVSSAAQYFQSRGGVVISSAGNSGRVNSLPPSPYITTVSATDPNDALYSWSTTGPRVTLSAPGCVYTSFNGNSYGGACGTSFSAPTVAGVAALVLAANPNLTPAQVTQILLSTADDLGTAGLDPQFGYGRVNAARAVAAAAGGTTAAPTPAPSPAPKPAPVDTIAPTISITSPSNGVAVSGNLAVTFQTSDNVGVIRVELLANGNVVGVAISAPFTIQWLTSRLARGTYILQGRARDAAGNVGLSQLVTVYR